MHCLLQVPEESSKQYSAVSSLAAVSQSQVAALDGAEWISLQCHLMERNLLPRGRFSKVGSMTIVTGTTTDSKERIVGIQAPANQNEETTIPLNEETYIYKSSMATIPPNVSDQTAISTVLGALVGVHCVLPKVEHVGGGTNEDDSFVSGKVLNINEYTVYSSCCSIYSLFLFVYIYRLSSWVEVTMLVLPHTPSILWARKSSKWQPVPYRLPAILKSCLLPWENWNWDFAQSWVNFMPCWIPFQMKASWNES